MNGLMEAIKKEDPFYADPIDQKYTRIYFHQQAAIKRLIELGEYPICAFVGMTKAERGFDRFKKACNLCGKQISLIASIKSIYIELGLGSDFSTSKLGSSGINSGSAP